MFAAQRLILSLLVIVLLQILSACSDAAEDAGRPAPEVPGEDVESKPPASPPEQPLKPPPTLPQPPAAPPITSSGWPVIMGANKSIDFATDIAMGADGYLYVTGGTNSELLSDTKNDTRYTESFVMKMNDEGQIYWITYTSAIDGGLFAEAIAVDDLGFVYFSGYTEGVTEGATSSGALEDLVFAKLDSSGNQVWLKQMGNGPGNYSYRANSIAVDKNQHVYIAGEVRGKLLGVASDSDDYLLAKFDSNGDLIWFNIVESTNKSKDFSSDLAMDESGNIYVTGRTAGNLASPSMGGYDLFVAKYNNSGTLQWTQQLGSSFDDRGESISVNASGYSCVAGWTLGDFVTTSNGQSDIVILYFDPDGNVLAQMQYGGFGVDLAKSVVIGSNPYECYVLGTTSGDLSSVSLGGNDIFVSKLNMETKSVLWEKHLGTDSDDEGFGLVVSKTAAFVVGSVMAPLTPTNKTQLQDVFVSKLFP